MPNTRGAAKRDRQSAKRNTRNVRIKSATKTAIRKVVAAVKSKDKSAPELFYEATRALSKAGGSGALPRGRAARKMSRLTQFAKKNFPDALKFKPAAGAAKTKKSGTAAAKSK